MIWKIKINKQNKKMHRRKKKKPNYTRNYLWNISGEKEATDFKTCKAYNRTLAAETL